MMGPVCWSLTLPLLLSATQDELQPFTSKEGRFTVQMPTPTMEKKQQITTATGTLNVTLIIAEGRLDSSFVVSYSDLPDKELTKGSVDKRLEQACKGAVESARGKLRGGEKPIKLDGHPGREIEIEKDGKIVARMRIFLVERRLYQVMVLGSGTIFSPKEKDVTTFLDSFRLNK